MDYKDIINSQEYVLVEFYALWCPHCRRMAPIVEQVKARLSGQVEVYQYDIDKNQSLAGEEQIDVVPTFILYNGGKEVWRKSGSMTESELLMKIQSHVGAYV